MDFCNQDKPEYWCYSHFSRFWVWKWHFWFFCNKIIITKLNHCHKRGNSIPSCSRDWDCFGWVKQYVTVIQQNRDPHLQNCTSDCVDTEKNINILTHNTPWRTQVGQLSPPPQEKKEGHLQHLRQSLCQPSRSTVHSGSHHQATGIHQERIPLIDMKSRLHSLQNKRCWALKHSCAHVESAKRSTTKAFFSCNAQSACETLSYLYSNLLYFAWAHQRHRQCCICHTAPERGTFVLCYTFYAPTHTISYLCMGGSAVCRI